MQRLDTCGCCQAPTTAEPARRRFIQGAALGLAALAFRPYFVRAAEGTYEAMVLSCIDPRMQEPVHAYLAGKNLTGQYSAFVIAGAAIGVVAPSFKAWHQAFWDNLATSIKLHQVNRVIVIDHRDCGAAKIAYGAEAVATPEAETKTHGKALAAFRKELKARHSHLGVETGLMALDGKIEMFG